MNKRQLFITETYYRNLLELYDFSESYWGSMIMEEDGPLQGESLKAYHIKKDSFKGLVIRYTAGEPVSSLFEPLERLISNYEVYQRRLAEYEGYVDIAPLNADELPADYEECVQVVSLCVLLDRTDLLGRFTKLMDGAGFYAQDTLYEDLLKKCLPGRADVDEWYHDIYTLLIKAVYAPDKLQAAEMLNAYCNSWYESFRDLQAPWHDSHLNIEDDDGSYFGYWAFEAGAIAYLYDIDDSVITDIVYPRDLVEYARNGRQQNSLDIPAKAHAGQPCPRAGYWSTAAQANSRRLFESGEEMPEFKGASWGSTTWYWSGNHQ